MSFIDEARGNIAAYHLNRCSIHRWLQTQDDLTDEDLRAAAAETSVAAVMRAMQRRGFPYKRSSVERHFNRECSCTSS